ncbi:MAG: prephenate dehydrogenase [Lachnospiraceae bacterium]|nr:prephenate dehydrogenase [Lachnospiraceae bacterium]
MTVGVVGLGLIGGSFVKAYKEAGHRVYGYDIDKTIQGFAMLDGTVDAVLARDNMKECDLLLITTYVHAAEAWFEKEAPYIDPHTVVIDCLGNKQSICRLGFSLAEKYGFTYVGGHPMAGTHNSGYKYSRANMFKNAPMVLVPPVYDDIQFLERIKKMLEPCGFGKLSVTTAEEHDRMIAFTSQMAHVVSNAYIKSPTAGSHKGFSAGSYKDLTRVAWLNPRMWAELFMDNKENMLKELDWMIASLDEYRQAILDEDEERLVRILDEGSKRKKAIDG